MIAFILQIEDDAGRKLMIEIYRHYFRLIKKHMSNAIPADDVEDCIQDCFVRLTANVQQLKKLDSPQITAYILRTIQSVIVDYKKKKKLLIVELDAEAVADNEFPSSVERIIEDREVYERFLAGFHTLSEFYQIILRGLYQEDFGREELAEKLGIVPSSIRTYISRAKIQAIRLIRGDSDEN